MWDDLRCDRIGVAWSELVCIIRESELNYLVYAYYLNPPPVFRIDSFLCPEELLLVMGLPDIVDIRLAFAGIEPYLLSSS